MMTRFATTLALMLALGGSVAEAQIARVSPIYRPATLSVTRVAPLPQPAPTSTATTATTAPARPGQLTVAVDENGAYAASTYQVRQAGRVIASGSSGSPIALPAGAYEVAITLETALDRPTRTVRVLVPEGGVATARASFSTSILEVRFTKDRMAVHGLATVRQGDRVIGTLGSGVTARVSAGTYEIEARYRTEVRSYSVTLAPVQRRALSAQF
jgi:hypothetical protein